MSHEGINFIGISPVSRRSMQSYVRTKYRLRNKEPLIAQGSHRGRGDLLVSVSAVPATRGQHEDSCHVISVLSDGSNVGCF